MPKLVTVLRPEKIQEQARIYVRSYILMPAGVVGLVCMIGGVGSLGYQLLANHTYTWLTFLASSGLLVVGALLWVGADPLSPLSVGELSRGVCSTNADRRYSTYQES